KTPGGWQPDTTKLPTATSASSTSSQSDCGCVNLSTPPSFLDAFGFYCLLLFKLDGETVSRFCGRQCPLFSFNSIDEPEFPIQLLPDAGPVPFLRPQADS